MGTKGTTRPWRIAFRWTEGDMDGTETRADAESAYDFARQLVRNAVHRGAPIEITVQHRDQPAPAYGMAYDPDAERIGTGPENNWWRCLCGNEADSFGFASCAPDGTPVGDKEWGGKHKVCLECGRIFDNTTVAPVPGATITDWMEPGAGSVAVIGQADIDPDALHAVATAYAVGDLTPVIPFDRLIGLKVWVGPRNADPLFPGIMAGTVIAARRAVVGSRSAGRQNGWALVIEEANGLTLGRDVRDGSFDFRFTAPAGVATS